MSLTRLNLLLRFENKKKALSFQKWLPVVENHLSQCPDKNYSRIACSYLGGKPRSFWQKKFYLRLKEGTPIENPSEFFRETMLAGYGLTHDVQLYWDTWNKLRQGNGEDISDYNIAFEQAKAVLADEIHDEQVLIDKSNLVCKSILRNSRESILLGSVKVFV